MGTFAWPLRISGMDGQQALDLIFADTSKFAKVLDDTKTLFRSGSSDSNN